MPARERLYFCLAVLLAALSVVTALGHMTHSIWLDESLTWLTARQPTLAGVAHTAIETRAYPPSFFLIQHYTMRWWPDEAGLRIPAAVLGGLAVFALFLLGRKLAGGLAGLGAALFLVLTPGVYRYFVDGNPYTLLLVAMSLSTLFLWRALDSDRAADWAGCGAFAVLGLATHLIFGVCLVAQLAAAIVARAARKEERPRPHRMLATMALLFAAEIVWVIYYLAQGGVQRPIVPARLLEFRVPLVAGGMYLGPLSFGHLGRLALWIPLQAIGGVFLFLRHRRAFWFIAIIAAIVVAGTTAFAVSTMRFTAYKHALAAFPLACLAAAYPLSFLRSDRRTAIAARCAAVLGAAYCISGAYFIATATDRDFEYQDWKGAAQFLKLHAGPSDAIVLSSYYGAPCLTYYDYGPARLAGSDDPSRRLDTVASLVQRAGAPGRAVWVPVASLSNENPAIGRYTESGKRSLEQQTRTLLEALRGRGLRPAVAGSFHRINLIRVPAA